MVGVISWLKLSASRARETLYDQRQGMDLEVGPNMLVPIGEWKKGVAPLVEDANEGVPPPGYSERAG